MSGRKRLAAWRVLDAQYFGVAQRRRRVFVIGVSLWGVEGITLGRNPCPSPGAPRRNRFRALCAAPASGFPRGSDPSGVPARHASARSGHGRGRHAARRDRFQ
ncbi:MAG: DNA cytosine methyltransferase [Pirellulaceae bacterium]